LGATPTVGGTLDLTLSGAGTLTGNRTLTVNNSGLTTLSGNISQDVAGRSLTRPHRLAAAVGQQHLLRWLDVSAGTLLIGHDDALGSGTLSLGTATVQASGGARTLAHSVTLAGDTTFGGSNDLTFSGTTILTGNRTLTMDNSGTTTFSGQLGQDTAGRTLTKAGSGTLVFERRHGQYQLGAP